MLVVKNISSIHKLILYILCAIFISACGGGGGGSSSSAPVVTLNALSMTNANSTLKVADTFQLNVTGTYSDSSTQDLSSSATWSVANSTVLSVSSTGLVKALSAGTTNVTASYGGLSIQRSISVKALVDLNISPSTLTLAIASAQQLSVTGLYTDNSTEAFDELVQWNSENPGIASISETGEVLAVSAGTVSITANVGAVSASLSVTVSPATLQTIVVSSQNTQIASGLMSTFFAKGIYSDGTEQNLSEQVVWSVSNPTKASINSETGLLTALQAGTGLVVATKEGLTGSLLFTVSPATLSSIAITPSVITLAKGTSENINVTAVFSDNSKQDVSNQVEWTNSNSLVANIDDNSSTVMALVEGTTTLSASLSGQQADLSVTVTDAELVSLSLSPVNTSIPLGRSQQYLAQGTYTDDTVQDLSSQVTWLSADENVALISNTQGSKGLVNSVALGSSTITAVLGGIQQQTELNIGNAILTSIEIQPSNQTVAKGTDAQVTAYGYYSDGSQIDLNAQVIWSTSNPSLLDLSSAPQGTARSLVVGSALLSAELDGISGIANIEISSAILQSIAIESEQASLAKGMNQKLIARGTYSDASTKDITKQVTWQSSDSGILTIANNATESGLMRAINVGQSQITASLGQLSVQGSFEVTDAVLTGIQVTSTVSQLNVKATTAASATATYSDNSTQNVTDQVNWTSSNQSVASVGNNTLNKGKVTALAVGNANISASLNGISSNILLLEVSLDPNLASAINLSIQPNVILNDNTDASQITLSLVPAGENGVIPDGTEVFLTISEGNNISFEKLVTTDGSVNYSLQSDYEGFISLSAISGNLSASSGLLAVTTLSKAIARQARTNILYEDNTLRAGSKFIVLLRNLSNRVFGIDQIIIYYRNSNNDRVLFPGMPVIDDEATSNGDLVGGEFTSIGYELDDDIEARIYGVEYYFTDNLSNSSFGLNAVFDFGQ